MGLIEKIILPQSSQHLLLLKYILVLTFVLFITYSSLLTGSFILSVFLIRKSKKNNNSFYKKLSFELIDIITFNKGIAFSLGIIPLLSTVFCYAQLLHLSGLIIPETILVSTLLFFFALLFIYTYKHSLHIGNVFDFVNNVDNNIVEEDVYNYRIKTNRLLRISSYSGIIFMFLSTYLFIASVEFTQNPERWNYANSYSGIIFSFNSLINYIQFILISLGIASLMLLLKNAKDREVENSYKTFVNKFSLKLSMINIVTLPVIVILTLFTKSKYSLSYNVFNFTLLALIFIFFVSILLYVMYKEDKIKYSFISVYLFIMVIVFLIIKDQYAFNTSAKKHFLKLASNYEEYQKKLFEASGLIEKKVNAEEIFNSKCVACHQFDKKVVGPPYNEVLPKYEGKIEELANFILNPTKINPEYPSMPNQGLKPKEAEALANFLLQTYKK